MTQIASAIERESTGHRLPVVARPEEHPGQVGRFGNITRMVFHPSEVDPLAPNAGTITYPAGTGFPLHKHDFAQLWYVLEGECQFGERTLCSGDMVYLGDPHVEHEMHTEHGCVIVFMQYPGPETGARPIYDKRFDADAQTADADMDLTR